MNKTRNLNLDIIRTVAIVFVLIGHFADHTGLYEYAQSDVIRFVSIALRMLLGLSVDLFMLLTGYLCCNKRLEGKYYLGLVRIYGVYLICSVITLVFKALVFHEEMGISHIIGSIVNFYACDYAWYMLMYLGLFLMIPFLNLVFNSLSSKKQHLALLATCVYFVVLPSFLNMFVQLHSIWWKNLFPILYYFAGAYIRRYQPKISPVKGGALLAALIVCFTAFYWVVLGSDGRWTITVTYHDYFQTFLLSVILFISLNSINITSPSKALSSIASHLSELSMAIYLMSGVSDAFLYPKFKALVPTVEEQFFWWIPVAMLSFVGALVLARIVMWLYIPFEKAVNLAIHRIFRASRISV